MKVIVCRFDGRLDEMKRKAQADPVEVLRVLAERPRFSVFEATANQTIARTMTRLQRRGLIEVAPEASFPWSKATLTQKGLDMLERALPPDP